MQPKANESLQEDTDDNDNNDDDDNEQENCESDLSKVWVLAIYS